MFGHWILMCVQMFADQGPLELDPASIWWKPIIQFSKINNNMFHYKDDSLEKYEYKISLRTPPAS